MCDQKIIENHKEPNEWQHHLVINEKPDKSLRMCLDPRELNTCIIKEMVQIPTIEEEMRSKLRNKKYIMLCVLKDRFYQCELHSDL